MKTFYHFLAIAIAAVVAAVLDIVVRGEADDLLLGSRSSEPLVPTEVGDSAFADCCWRSLAVGAARAIRGRRLSRTIVHLPVLCILSGGGAARIFVASLSGRDASQPCLGEPRAYNLRHNRVEH